MARPSAAGSLRASGYRSIAMAILQLGPGATSYLATPALPTLLAEVRAVVAASDPTATAASGAAGSGVTVPSEGVVRSNIGGAGTGGMRIEPAMSARKSSQKKQRRSREKEVGRALAAADAAIDAAATSLGSSGGVRGASGGGGVGVTWTGVAALAEREAVCSGLVCLAQLVLCCKGHMPLGGRLAVENVVYQGLVLLVRAVGVNSCRDGVRGGSEGSRGLSRLENPRVVQNFLGLAHACLVTPLVSAITVWGWWRIDVGAIMV